MRLFDQKPRFASRPLEWLTSAGHARRDAAMRFMRQLSQEFNSPKERDLKLGSVTARLLPLRGDFRQMMQYTESIPSLQFYQNNVNPLIRAIAVWLLSHHASRFSMRGIEGLRHDQSPMVRKRVARALRKLEARQLLLSMAQDYPDDPTIQWYATQTPNVRTHQERLDRFMHTANATRQFSDDQPSRMPLWFRDEYWSGSPPKSIEYMRTILRRIQALVHG